MNTLPFLTTLSSDINFMQEFKKQGFAEFTSPICYVTSRESIGG
jgi:hypothetical protein